NIANSTITVIDSKKYNIIKNIQVERAPVGVDIDIEKNLIFVTNYLSNSISIINGTNHSIIKTIKVCTFIVTVKINHITKKLKIILRTLELLIAIVKYIINKIQQYI